MLRHGLIDQGHGSLGGFFGVGQVSATHERDVERLTETRRRRNERDDGLLAARHGLPLHNQVPAATATTKRNEVRRERRLDPGQALDSANDVPHALGLGCR